MWCPDELKLNAFKDIRIPKGAEYMNYPEFGKIVNSPDNIPEGHASVAKTKLDAIAEDFDRIRQELDDNPDS